MSTVHSRLPNRFPTSALLAHRAAAMHSCYSAPKLAETADRSSRKRRTTSSVWAHTREPRSAEPIRCGRKNERIYYCAYCNDLSYSTIVSTTFRHHLLKVHGIELEAELHPIKRQRDNLLQDAFTKARHIAASKQSTEAEQILRGAINQKAAPEALAQLVTVRNLPHNCSSWPELHAFIASIRLMRGRSNQSITWLCTKAGFELI